ncbi:hypothetical protein LFML04_0580 [Leptospirillum ferriphilum ML-04]|uniref:Uncharacterized protein n=1 Tax=Leptospirillum ferriphilum (strain ML-04) TaxID=1048260 RepID=J9Z9K8_LEPFM|nr:hypothetical protein LFML04_0580 [Leptospirillum ferriphilum ML-04]
MRDTFKLDSHQKTVADRTISGPHARLKRVRSGPKNGPVHLVHLTWPDRKNRRGDRARKEGDIAPSPA